MGSDAQPDAREGQAGRPGVAERFVVPLKPGNAGEGKGPQFKTNATRGRDLEIGEPINSEKCSETAEGVARESEEAEAGYRFYALYDKISREDILAHAYAQCRSNKGAPGVDGQEFADIERSMGCSGGSANWRLRSGSRLIDRTLSRVFIPKANGKLRPLGISTLRDRVCMTAAMLVLEPIFEADLPPEQYSPRSAKCCSCSAAWDL